MDNLIVKNTFIELDDYTVGFDRSELCLRKRSSSCPPRVWAGNDAQPSEELQVMPLQKAPADLNEPPSHDVPDSRKSFGRDVVLTGASSLGFVLMLASFVFVAMLAVLPSLSAARHSQVKVSLRGALTLKNVYHLSPSSPSCALPTHPECFALHADGGSPAFSPILPASPTQTKASMHDGVLADHSGSSLIDAATRNVSTQEEQSFRGLP
jgi:hypothetical protein